MTHILGILNITPDSFSDGGKYESKKAALAQAAQLFTDGATHIDVGAESTRPQAEPLTPAQEWARLTPILPQLLEEYGGLVSLDSYHPETVEKFLQLGGTIINDVSGFLHPRMRDLAAEYGAKCIVNHFPASTVHEVHELQIDSVAQVEDELMTRRKELLRAGVAQSQIVLDPGIGFGKTTALNHVLLEFAAVVPDMEVLIGFSKKRFLGEDRKEKEPNVIAAEKAIAAGAQWLRVHEPAWYGEVL